MLTTKSKLSFPSDDAVKKMVYLSLMEIEKKWTQPIHNWGLIMNQFMLMFENRMTLSKILCKWKQDSAVSLFLYLDSVFKNKHKLIHNQAPVMNRLCPFLLNLHK